MNKSWYIDVGVGVLADVVGVGHTGTGVFDDVPAGPGKVPL